MQTAVHKMDSASRYGSDISSSHNSTGNFSGRGAYRRDGPHNESARVLNQNPSYGAQFHSSEKSKNYNESESSDVPPYMGWQNMNSTSSNTWNVSDSKPVVGRGIHGNRDSSKDENMSVDNEPSSFGGLVGATGGAENYSEDGNSNFQNASRGGQLPRLGLLGGGETSMVSPPSNWSGSQGLPVSNATWGVNLPDGAADMGGNSSAGTPTKPPPQGSWAQAAGKGLPPTPNNPSEPQTPTATDAPSIKDQENKDFRLKVAFSEGWGQTSINQEMPWDVAEAEANGGDKDNPPSAVWRSPVNNGTEIWESSMRKGVAPPAAPPGPTSQPPPWGHTPATNIGGHWGEDDPSWNQRPPAEVSWSENACDSNTWNASLPTLIIKTNRRMNSQESWNESGANNQERDQWNNRNRTQWSPLATPKKEPPPTGWEPPSPPSMRRPPPSGNFDDGTAVWGNPTQPQRPGKQVSHWKDMPPAKPIVNSSVRGMPPKGDPTWNKPPPRYAEPPSPTLGGNWSEENKPYGWANDNNGLSNWGAKPKQNANWADGQVDTSSWLGPAKQVIGGKPLCKDIVHASKQFRILTELGYRKEDVENALRNNSMNFEEAAAELQAMGAMDVDSGVFGGRKVRPYEEPPEPQIDNFMASSFHPSSNFQNFPPPHNKQMNKGVAGGTNNLSPALIQKLLQQQQQQQQQQQSLQLLNLNNMQAFGNQKLGSNSQIRHLLQQIQVAVQAGHLNAQILNHPLSPPTLQVLYQLLQQIKVLSALHQQMQLHSGSKQPPGPNTNAQLIQMSVQIAQTKNRISQLQAQICQQQTHFIKQQQQQQQPQVPLQQQDGQLQNDFRDLSLKDFQQNQSRLTQWKSPSFESVPKDHESSAQGGNSAGDFSRAPGPSKGNSGHGLLEQNDSTWARNPQAESVWSDVNSTSNPSNGASTGVDNKDAAYNFSDLVPEFEPGKPWKGTQIKNVEDDPHITPGSIAPSPLALGSLKDSNLFWQPPTALKSDTWYPPTTSSSAKPGKAGGWNSDFSGGNSDLWPAKSSRNAPPGWERQNNSTFLVLRNLTPQIDGSTLKTLCMQHGPLQMFHLFLSRGVALVRYSSCEEAAKAQGALNNCVLGNTTMLADIPSEIEVQQYLQVASGQASGTSWPTSQPSGGSTTAGGSAGNTSTTYYGGSTTGWNNNNGSSSAQLWSFSNSSLWGPGQTGKEHESGTNPISYLPNDLLGGEPM